MRTRRIRKLVCLVLFLLNTAIPYNSYSQAIYKNAKEDLQIGKEIYYLEDKTNQLTINEVANSDKFVKSVKDVPSFGIISSSLWVRVSIKNESENENLILQLNQPIIDEVDYYIYSPESKNYTVIEMGEYKFFKLRKYLTPEYLFDLNIAKGAEKTCYLKIKCKENMQLPISVGTNTSLFEFSGAKNIASGIYIGIMLVMILYNLFIFGSVREKSYLYYTLYIIVVLFTQTSYQGIPYQYVWPNFPWLQTYSQFLLPSLVGIAGLEFFKEFLQLKTRSPRVYILSYLFIIPYTISILLSFDGQYGASFQIMQITASSVALFMLVFAIIIYRRGYQEARFFLIGWSMFLIGVIIFILKDVDVLPYNNITRYTMHFGSGFEVILLSFALGDRINILKKETELSQAQVLEALQENEKLIKEQNIVLEQKVG